jgi:hypothetical protein
MDTVELVATALYSIDIVVQFNVAWIAVSEDLKQILVLDGKKIAKVTPSLIFPLYSAAPHLTQQLVLAAAQMTHLRATVIFVLL